MDFLVDYFKSLVTPAGLIGLVALGVAIASFQQKESNKIVLFQLASSTLFTIHFALINAYIGAVINLMSAFRALIYAQKDKKWAMHPVWTFVFSGLSVLISLVFWEGWISIFPALGSIFYTVSLRFKSSKLVRIFSLPSSPCWIIYNALKGSIPGVLTEMYVIISILIGMLRHDRKKNNMTN